jgi:hypothetical protein
MHSVQFWNPIDRRSYYINQYKLGTPPSPLYLGAELRIQVFGRLILRLRSIWGLSGPDIYFSYMDEAGDEHFWLVVDYHFVRHTWQE